MKCGRRHQAYDHTNSTGDHAGGCQDQWRGSGEVTQTEAIHVD